MELAIKFNVLRVSMNTIFIMAMYSKKLVNVIRSMPPGSLDGKFFFCVKEIYEKSKNGYAVSGDDIFPVMLYIKTWCPFVYKKTLLAPTLVGDGTGDTDMVLSLS